jgi:hypothetical protein
VTAATPPYLKDAGGTHLTITGSDLQGVAPKDGGELMYLYADADVATEQHSGYVVNSDTSVSANAPASNPGSYIVTVCNITICSAPNTLKQFNNTLVDFYQPGDPTVTSVSTKSGPASGGTRVVVHGTNLSDAVEVDFGSTPSTNSRSAPALLSNGSSTKVIAIAPPGKPGVKVNITVITAESIAEGHPSPKTKAATFTYKTSVPSAPQDVKAKAHTTTLNVTWKAPVSNGGHAIRSYVVTAVAQPNSFKRHAPKPKPSVAKVKGAKATSASVKHLKAGWTYEVKVQAVNSLGRGLAGKDQKFFAIAEAP